MLGSGSREVVSSVFSFVQFFCACATRGGEERRGEVRSDVCGAQGCGQLAVWVVKRDGQGTYLDTWPSRSSDEFIWERRSGSSVAGV